MPKVNCGCDGAPQAQRLLIYHGPELLVDIGFDEKYDRRANIPPTPGATNIKALVDTGARESCIDTDLAARLNLPQCDRRVVSTANGLVTVDFYLAQVYVRALRFAIDGPFAAVPLIASKFRCEALLGRSFLSYVQLNYDGPTGKVEISL